MAKKRKGNMLECDYCGRTFESNRGGVRYCSNECENLDKESRKRSHRGGKSDKYAWLYD